MDDRKFLQYNRYLAYQDKNASDDELPVFVVNQQVPAKARGGLPLSKNNVCQYLDDNGILCRLTPYQSNWYILYVSNAPKTRAFYAKFRCRFRLPYNSFISFVAEARSKNWFPRWTKITSSPLELMMLGSLRYLGRGWTFDDIEESTGIDEETHRQFFHHFINIGSTALYNQHVVTPTTPARQCGSSHA